MDETTYKAQITQGGVSCPVFFIAVPHGDIKVTRKPHSCPSITKEGASDCLLALSSQETLVAQLREGQPSTAPSAPLPWGCHLLPKMEMGIEADITVSETGILEWWRSILPGRRFSWELKGLGL